MVAALILGVGAVVTVAYLLQPLVTEDATPVWDEVNWLPDSDERKADPTQESMRGRAIADGGRHCPNCGTHVDGDYTFCGECLTPVV